VKVDDEVREVEVEKSARVDVADKAPAPLGAL
jgi:hypothetical protein